MPWYAVHTRSRHEDLVCLGLTQKAYHAFLPKLEVWSKRKDRRKKIMIPMFPGYLFVELLSLENEVKVDVLKTFGVVRILGKPRGAEPIAIPDAKIDAIAVDKGSKDRFKMTQTNIKVGKQPADLFEIPRGFQAMNMGGMGDMLKGMMGR